MNNVINDNVCDSLRFERWGLNVDVDSLNGKLTFSRRGGNSQLLLRPAHQQDNIGFNS